MADKIVVMRDGRILQVGTPTDLYENPVDVFTARFIGSPSMNLLSGSIQNGELSINKVVAEGVNARAFADGQVSVGVRPHDLLVGAPTKTGFEVSGIVTAVEPLGSETLVHLDIAGAEAIATAPGRLLPKAGSTVTATALPGALYLFDTQTEQALGRL